MHPLMALRLRHDDRQTTRLGTVLGSLLALGLLVGAAACGDDDDDAASTSDDTSRTTETEAPGNADNLGPDDLSGEAATTDVVAVDYHFEGLPDSITAGSRLTMHNESAAEVHEMVVMAIPETETRSVDELVELPEPELFAAVPGEPALVMVAPPGEDAVPVIGDGTLDAGRYLALCVIPTGADPDEYMQAAQEAQDGPPVVDGGPPHFTAGMYAELVVE